MKNLGVLVGKGFDFRLGGQEKIASKLKSSGYQVKLVDDPWPRNSYVFFNGKYVLEDEQGKDNVFGNGGMVLKGNGFLLVSDAAFLYNNFKSKVDENRLKNDREYYEESKNLIKKEGKKVFNSRVHVAPTGNFFNGNSSSGDIDMFSLVLPNNKILIFDTFFGKDANKHKHYNKIAEEEGLEFIEYDGKKDNVWYPLNCLVIPYANGDEVFLDSNSKSLINILNKKGVKSIGIDMPQREHAAGKIHCQTNVFDVNSKGKINNFI
ncbi:MAG: hypothetical protein ACP5NZ_00025 [Nanobdellota archaeon]